MSLVTGSSLPLVIVESCSMYHNGNLFSNFDVWWDKNQGKYSNYGISKEDFLEYSFKNGFNKGDILFVYGTDEKDLEVGDIIVFNANYRNPVVHRIIEVSEENGKRVFSTMGDNNNGQLPFEKKILRDQILGEVKANVAPYIGWGKLIFFEHLKPESERGFC
jgi:signal peptidase I